MFAQPARKRLSVNSRVAIRIALESRERILRQTIEDCKGNLAQTEFWERCLADLLTAKKEMETIC